MVTWGAQEYAIWVSRDYHGQQCAIQILRLLCPMIPYVDSRSYCVQGYIMNLQRSPLKAAQNRIIWESQSSPNPKYLLQIIQRSVLELCGRLTQSLWLIEMPCQVLNATRNLAQLWSSHLVFCFPAVCHSVCQVLKLGVVMEVIHLGLCQEPRNVWELLQTPAPHIHKNTYREQQQRTANLHIVFYTWAKCQGWAFWQVRLTCTAYFGPRLVHPK